MSRPVLLAVDDDRVVADAVARDLRRRYAQEYRIVRTASGPEALSTLEALRARGDRAALVLADHRMPEMTGVELLARSVELYPSARRVLLTAYADTEAAIRAINEAEVHHYLLKPWEPAEERLFPVLDELLDDWWATDRPPFDGVRLIGHRFSERSHQLRDLLARNHVPYQWLEHGREDEARVLLDAVGAGPEDVPVVVLPDGAALPSPTNVEVLGALGLSTEAQQPFYDLVIVGGGPAGLAAAVYGASEGLSTLLVEREAPGGQAAQSSHIANYLGFPRGIAGAELSRRALVQAEAFGAEILRGRVAGAFEARGPARSVLLEGGGEVNAHALIVATGVSYNRLPADGADPLVGAGIFYGAAMTETDACRGEDVYVVGGANSAGQAAVHLAKGCRTVTLLVRADDLTRSMSTYLVRQIAETPNIVLRPHTVVARAEGTDQLERLWLRDLESGRDAVVDTSWLFVFIGAAPRTEWLGNRITRDEHGFILTGPPAIEVPGVRWDRDRPPYPLETSVPGVFAAGDVRSNSMKRVTSAVGEGGMSVHLVHRYLQGER